MEELKENNAPVSYTHLDVYKRQGLSAEEKGDAVKAEKAHAAPVERADDSKRQRDLVDDHEVPSLKRWFEMCIRDSFKTVMADGVLPRKTFSMGHAQDKRYYVEARKIR